MKCWDDEGWLNTKKNTTTHKGLPAWGEVLSQVTFMK